MLAIARKGDQCSLICAAHGQVSGQITSGSALSTDEGLPIARVGDQVQGVCGHTGMILNQLASQLTFDEGNPVALVGTKCGGGVITGGEITQGSSLTLSD